MADFITGRSIGESDRIVAVAIVPTEGGWPDAVKAAACTPIYPHDRFTPLSLPMTGGLDDNGFFSPDRDQIALKHLLAATQLDSWEAFQTAMNPKDNAFELSHPNKEMVDRFGIMRRKVVPGLSVMHESTYETVCALSEFDEDVAEAAARAAIIAMDASERLVIDGDDAFLTQARLGKPDDSTYETKSGRCIEVPKVSGVLSETAPWRISVYAKDAITRSHRNSHTTDGSALRATFEAFAGFQRLAIGLRVLNRYYAPSCFTRSDNLFEVVEFQLASIDSAVKGISSKPPYGPEYGEETGERLAALAKSLRATLDAVEWEMAAYPAYADYSAPKF
ncbi:hypothetical protein GOB57_23995 [Sinorhizobium meliloti]|nr:hypothetical protein [Sinorhizobium meliloti]